MKTSQAQIVGEFGPFPGVEKIHGVSFDGTLVWMACGERLNGLDPHTGKIVRHIDVPAFAGTAFDGRHLFQIADDRIQKIDAKSGKVLGTIPAPEGGASGMAWAEGALWVGQYRKQQIHQVDPDSGKILRTIPSDKFVTGVTWLDGALWHGTWEAERSELRRIDAASGEVKERIELPPGIPVSGLESDGKDRFFCGGSSTGRLRVVKR